MKRSGAGLLMAPRGRTVAAREVEVGVSDALRATAERLRALAQPLPRVDDTSAPIAASTQARRPAGVNPTAAGSVHVLVVDDQAAVLGFLRRLLHAHEITALTSPLEAVARIARGERFDVILSDMTMAEMPGHVLYEAIWNIAQTQAERMAFMTGGVFTADAAAFLASTNRPIIRKPFRAAEVHALLKSFPGRAR